MHLCLAGTLLNRRQYLQRTKRLQTQITTFLTSLAALDHQEVLELTQKLAQHVATPVCLVLQKLEYLLVKID